MSTCSYGFDWMYNTTYTVILFFSFSTFLLINTYNCSIAIFQRLPRLASTLQDNNKKLGL